MQLSETFKCWVKLLTVFPKRFERNIIPLKWMRIIRTRHILVHDYFGLDYEILWRIVTVHLFPLQLTIKQILDNEPLGNADIEPM
jgi:uncharacterized protein with HEPN domain